MRYLYENLGELESPSGSNDLGSNEAHEQSVYYDIAFPQRRTQALPIILRANIRGLYGKVDLSGFIIAPKESYISQIDTEEGSYKALYIVKECFEELATYYNRLDSRNKLMSDSVALKEIVPKRAWKSLAKDHKSYQQNIITSFIEDRDLSLPEIKDYKTFEKIFAEHCKIMDKPFTMSGFGGSIFSSPLSTGLVIDLAMEDASDDKAKYEGFIQDPNFEVFRRAVNRFGFRFDAHVPWRIYFDVSHKYSRQKMSKYGVNNLKEFFNKYYDRVAQDDFNAISELMFDAYSELYSLKSTYSQPSPCGVKILEREEFSLKKMNSKYTSSHWLRLYAYIRSVESKKKWNQVKFNSVVQKSKEIEKYRGSKEMIENLEPYFLDKTLDLFSERDLTKQNSFDRMISDFRF